MGGEGVREDGNECNDVKHIHVHVFVTCASHGEGRRWWKH